MFFKIIFNFMKKLFITVLLIPPAILLCILAYSEVLFVVIYYLWVKPKFAYELWKEFKDGIKTKKLFADRRFYIGTSIGLILIIIGYLLGR